MPDSCVKMSAPTMALARGDDSPAACGDEVAPTRASAADRRRCARRRRGRSATTTSSSGALPARSPSPSTVTLARRAPARIAAKRVGGGEAEIVMAMELDRRSVSSRKRRDRFVGRERIEQAERIGEAQAERAGLPPRAGDAADVARIGARRILAAERDFKALVARIADDARDARRRAPAASHFELDLHLQARHRRRNIDTTRRRPRAPRRCRPASAGTRP